MAFVYAVNGPGLFGTFGMRSIENTTSSAVSSLPSWNFTPLRSLNSQVLSSIVFHDVARPGIMRESGSICTSLSKMCSAMLLLGKRLKKCGSIDVTSAATATLSSCACTVAVQTPAASAATAVRRETTVRIRIGDPELVMDRPRASGRRESSLPDRSASKTRLRLVAPIVAARRMGSDDGEQRGDERVVGRGIALGERTRLAGGQRLAGGGRGGGIAQLAFLISIFRPGTAALVPRALVAVELPL